MKPQPAPYVPGDTDAERMDNAVRKMFSVSKAEVLKREAEWARPREEEAGQKVRLIPLRPVTPYS